MNKRAKFRKFLSLLLTLAMALGICGTALADEVTGLEDESVTVTIDGEEVELTDADGDSVAPIIVDGSTYLPIRAVAEALGLDVDWDRVNREVQLATEKQGSFTMPPKIDKSTQQRVLITTDLEVDDMNGILLTMLYSTDYDIAGIVWTAGMYHFSGDGGEHTLGEITPNWRCMATTAGGTVENAGQLTEFRPVDPGFLTRVVDVYYRADYEYLSKNNPNYPDPDYLLSVTKEGNVQFEGDYRYETEGSQLIYDAIMDDDPRPLYIQHWGGINTTVRALMSIYEDYHDTDQWEAVLKKVTDKVRLVGSGEDNCRADSKIDELFPGLQDSTWKGFGNYGQFFSALKRSEVEGMISFFASSDRLNPYYQAEWLVDAFKFNHGQLLTAFHLFNDGQPLYGEPELFYQYGLINSMDWQVLYDNGYSDESVAGIVTEGYDTYVWMCCQFGCGSFIDIGLRQGVTNSNERYVEVLFEELAARADWAVCEPQDCNHAPIVTADTLDYTAKAGETVSLSGSATDPDGDTLKATWWVPANATAYMEGKAENLAVSAESGWTTEFTVPADAEPGTVFAVNLEVQDTGVERPMTRFAQFFITVAE